jgi:hypothetical protein
MLPASARLRSYARTLYTRTASETCWRWPKTMRGRMNETGCVALCSWFHELLRSTSLLGCAWRYIMNRSSFSSGEHRLSPNDQKQWQKFIAQGESTSAQAATNIFEPNEGHCHVGTASSA